MEALLTDLLIYARTTRLEKPAEPTDANHALQAALTTLKGAVEESGAIINFEPLPRFDILSGNGGALCIVWTHARSEWR
jgi:light-regulated signal transduction histidine kinase (bacteriophytochrome)